MFAALDDEDVIFSLLEDLFTIREIKETSQRLAVARQLDAGQVLLRHRRSHRRVGHHHRPRVEVLSYGAGGYNAALTPWTTREEAPLARSPASGILPQARFCRFPSRIASRIRQPGELGP